MKKNLSIVLLSCMTLVAAAQDRYIVAPNGEAIPLGPNESALQVAQQHGLVPPNSVLTPCGVAGGTVGNIGPGNQNFGFGNGDVCLQKLISPVTGVIETVYFRSYLANTIPDSSCTVRIFNSNWTAAHPEPLGIACWGYYRWPQDPTGVSFSSPYVDDPPGNLTWKANTVGAFDPNGAELWGGGGYTTTWHRAPDASGYINAVNMVDLGVQPPVTAGQAFNVCIRTPSMVTPPPTDRSEMLAATEDISFSTFAKFYYRGRTVGDSTTFGWWHREFTMNIWAVVVSGPRRLLGIWFVSQVPDTLGSVPAVVRAGICHEDADTVYATLQYTILPSTTFIDVPMVNVGGDGWEGTIPAQPAGSTVGYRVRARDSHGRDTTSQLRTYGLINLNRDGYTVQFGAPYSWVDITGAGGGTQIPVSAFFNTAGPNDDGTAGPFDVGGIFTGLFGRSQRYAWVGVNGAMCLSNSSTDTVRVGNGYSLYNIPTTAAPRNFIGGFWNDLIIGAGGHGSIWYKVSGNQFIVEWYHIGNFNTSTDTATTFEMILDRGVTPPTITFQYQSVGNTTLATDGVVAIQDTVSNISRYVRINRSGYPVGTRLHDSLAIKLSYTGVAGVQQSGGEAPLQYSLSANYPNPFNPSTKINFSIPTASHVRLTVHNILGQVVATLLNADQTAGTYTVDFTPTNLASGVYFYKVVAGSYRETKKMLLLR